jgi:hypothetical protein
MINTTEISPIMKWDDPRGGVCFVQFQWMAERNNALTANEGRPIYDKVLMATIQIHSSNKQKNSVEIERWIGEGEKKVLRFREWPGQGHGVTQRMRFEAQLLQWEKLGAAAGDGTPLESWIRLDVAQIASLKAQGIATIESLSSVPDSSLAILGLGGRTLRDQAQAFLDSAKKDAPIAQITARLAQKDEENADLKAQMEALKVQLAALGGEPRKKPGPKPRVVEAA